jgi:putative drug exporter of the RND superfamily
MSYYEATKSTGGDVMFARLGKMVTGHPWRVLAVWIAAVAVIVPLAPSLASVTSSDQTSFLPSSYESAKAQKLADRLFPQSSGATALFVVERADGGRLNAADERKVAALAQTLAADRIPRVTGAQTSAAQRAPNEKAQLVRVAFEGTSQAAAVQSAITPLRERASAFLKGSGLEAGLTGDAAIAKDTKDSFGSAELIVAVATVTLIIVLLGLIFRSPIASLLPIASIGIVYVLATKVLALLAKGFGFHVDQSLTSLLIVVLFGIGTDYILFLLFRYRERLRAGDDSKAAVRTSVRRVGEAIASSGLVVMAAMIALTLSDLGSFKSMAPGFIVSVAMMLLASLTLIPALLSLLGPRVFWPSRLWQRPSESRVYKRLGGLIARRPAVTALASGGVLVALAAGLLWLKPSYDTTSTLPSNTKAATAFTQLKSAFPAGALNPTHVYVTSAGALRPAELDRMRSTLQRVDGVTTVTAPVLSSSGTAARIDVSIKENPTSTAALDLVSGPLSRAAHAAAAPGERVLVGGQTMATADVRSATNHDYTLVFPVAALLILLILGALLRSVVAPVVLLVGVGLGFAATLGASVFAFQGIKGDAGVVSMLPMIVYLFVVAVGTDYNILLTSRLREEIGDGVAPREAAARAVEHAGPTVASAGIILAGTFGSLMLTGVDLLSEMGFAVAGGIVLVAIVMASVLIPSLATLIGDRLWWPGHRPQPEGHERLARPTPTPRPTGELAPTPVRAS